MHRATLLRAREFFLYAHFSSDLWWLRPLLEAGGEAEELELEDELGEVEASTATSVEVSHISHDFRTQRRLWRHWFVLPYGGKCDACAFKGAATTTTTTISALSVKGPILNSMQFQTSKVSHLTTIFREITPLHFLLIQIVKENPERKGW